MQSFILFFVTEHMATLKTRGSTGKEGENELTIGEVLAALHSPYHRVYPDPN